MSESKLWIDRWIKVLHTQDVDLASTYLSPDICVLAYHQGEGGPQTRFDGRDAVVRWVKNAPLGSFIFERLSDNQASPSSELPAGELTVEGDYRVTRSTGDFTNTGHWTLVISNDAIAGVLHVPQPI